MQTQGEMATMKIDLTTLQPNPTRNLRIDPISSERIDMLVKSIGEHGFWGGIVVGQLNGDAQRYCLAGHGRLEAAKQAGFTTADLFVCKNPTPEKMLRIYAEENATQRGTDSTSVAGTVAGAIRIIAKALLIGNMSGFPDISPKAFECAAGNLASAKGIGEPIVSQFLKGIPGMDENVVRQQIALLKASGEYAHIIREVEKEIIADRVLAEEQAKKAKSEAERKKAEADVEKAKEAERSAAKAKAKAAEAETTFDQKGVQKYLKQADHVQKFRKLVTGPGLADILPVDRQADLAKAIVTNLPEGAELTSKWIRDETMRLLGETKAYLTAVERERVRNQDILGKARDLQHHFARQIKGAMADIMRLGELLAENKSINVPMTPEFAESLEDLQQIARKYGPKARGLLCQG